MSRTHLCLLPLALSAALMLTGCGGSPAPKTATPTEKHIFISAKDCAAAGKMTLERCGELIDGAIEMHVKNAPTYKSERACEAVEGGDRCERTDKQAFRPRLLAFAVISLESQASAIPLYATTGGEEGFRGPADKQIFLTTDDSLVYSDKALAVYEMNRFKAVARSGGGF